ncbi:unnamed protein product [Rhizophagus irregularis]|uniref:Uncharacterized protein n=1 Tax=Rhizophagus irregularis TaxID=588596 RepID=A0A2I1GXC6_9GLOM|nr:hypothetical protein RhiirA4_468207 [Rhizophagus irregularis]CAB4445235.1 unnamed protein product [Rhizophagus irregularis]CAB4445252.1 unnamed protein product [Rhizophagus irregularis]
MEKSHEYNQYMDEIIKSYDFSATSSTNSSIPLTYENFQRDQSQDYIGRIHSQIGFGTFVENIQQDQSRDYIQGIHSQNGFGTFSEQNQGQSRRDNIILDGAREEINANITSPPGPSPSFEAQTYLDGGYNTNYASFSGLDSSFGAHVTEEIYNTNYASFPGPPFVPSQPSQNNVQSIVNFLNSWFNDDVQEVTFENVDQFIKQHTGSQLFTEIRGLAPFREKDYKNNGKCEWIASLEMIFLFLLEQEKKVVRQLTSNRGYIKRGLWEYIAYTLSRYANKNVSPLQCARKWKNIKSLSKKNNEYKYKFNVDKILGSDQYD